LKAIILLLDESKEMEGARNKHKDDDAHVADVEIRVKTGFYNSDEFCREIAEVILDSSVFWRKESQSKAHNKVT
tara:strand:+ start:1125 stop:1346 length:222 start_codon:yes stop_codon:yes gene_type:complete